MDETIACSYCNAPIELGETYQNLYRTEHVVSKIEGETCQPSTWVGRLCELCWDQVKPPDERS